MTPCSVMPAPRWLRSLTTRVLVMDKYKNDKQLASSPGTCIESKRHDEKKVCVRSTPEGSEADL